MDCQDHEYQVLKTLTKIEGTNKAIDLKKEEIIHDTAMDLQS